YPGAGGGSYNTSPSHRGGNGGGLIEIVAAGTVTLDGGVHANGEAGTSYGAGGAGGGVFIDADVVAGAGTLQARGGAGHVDQSTAGGGGRVAIHATTGIQGVLGGNAPWSKVDVSGGVGRSSEAAGAG